MAFMCKCTVDFSPDFMSLGNLINSHVHTLTNVLILCPRYFSVALCDYFIVHPTIDFDSPTLEPDTKKIK